jgi:rhamnulokinase
MKERKFLAFDLGAASGRAVLGSLKSGHLTITVIHRFSNRMIGSRGHWHWDLNRLWREIMIGIKKCHRDRQAGPESIGIDTWGVDFGLLDENGRVIGKPYTYRDPHTRGMVDRFCRRLSRGRLYRITGTQILEINSLFQVAAIKSLAPGPFKKTCHLLFMPDLFNYLLTGVRSCDYTIAATSQMMNCRRKVWSPQVFRTLGVSRAIMPDIIMPGRVMGRLKGTIARELNVPQLPVVAVAGHDTASAVGAIPARGRGWAFISSGTWSLMGVETRRPIINRRAFKYNFTNEGGIAGRIRFLKNITGLWLLQECRRSWSRNKNVTYEAMNRAAAAAGPARSLIDPDWTAFQKPPDMIKAIQDFYRRTGQEVLTLPADIVRSILESLALKYRLTIDQLSRIGVGRIRTIHIVGGGSRNRLLCQFTANATGLEVVAGPIEATAIGNILVQAMAAGSINTLRQARDIVRRSFPRETYGPVDHEHWLEKYEIFLAIAGK